MISPQVDGMAFDGNALSINDAPLHYDDHRQTAPCPGADQLTERLPERTHTLTECGVRPAPAARRNGAAPVGWCFVMGDNRSNAEDWRFRLSGSFLLHENLQGRAFRARGCCCRSTMTILEPTFWGEQSMINNVYLGRSQ